MIDVRDVTKRYGRTTAVDRLSFQVRSGQVTGFVGPNGAGKSTTMRMMLGLDSPTSGEVLINGSPYRRLRDPLRQVGAALDTRTAHPGRSAYHHLLWLAQTHRFPRSRVREVLALVGLESVADRRAGRFSLGMAQRLGIAAALLGDPPVLLFDEPANGLDPEGILWIRTLMNDLAAGGRTVLVSSHFMAEIALTAQHLVVIGRGRLLADTSTRRFIEDNSRSYVRIRAAQPERLREALAGTGIAVEEGPDGTLRAPRADPAAVGEVAAANGVIIHEISTQMSTLEDAFLRLTSASVEYRPEALS